MKIVLDFQACQSASRYRGVGRGSKALMYSMTEELIARGHRVVFLLNRGFRLESAELIEEIEGAFPEAEICPFEVPSPCAPHEVENEWRQAAARLLRECCVAALRPDFIYLPALLADGWGDDAVSSVNEMGFNIPTAVTQHDLIPLAMEDLYLPPSRFRDYYMRKLVDLRKAHLFMAISEFSRVELMSSLGISEEDVICIGSAVASDFTRVDGSSERARALFRRLGVRDGFMLYAPGGFDPRKNVERLLQAFSGLASELRSKHQLVVASKLEAGRRENILRVASALGLEAEDIILTDYVSEYELRALYSACHAYIFPSLHEGFGLSVLEAMACGAPVVASNCTGIPEVVGLEEALFDPYRVESIRAAIVRVLSDESFRQRLKIHAKAQVGEFSWRRSAVLAVDAIERKEVALSTMGRGGLRGSILPSCDALMVSVGKAASGVMPTGRDLEEFRRCFNENLRRSSL